MDNLALALDITLAIFLHLTCDLLLSPASILITSSDSSGVGATEGLSSLEAFKCLHVISENTFLFFQLSLGNYELLLLVDDLVHTVLNDTEGHGVDLASGLLAASLNFAHRR